MLPNATLDIERTGNIDGRSQHMGIDQNSIEFIMSILTNLYSDPMASIIREYSTNALDSHIEANQDRPVEISLPGPLSPFFKVKDYGVGLSVEEVFDTYGQYGASTKRDSNTQAGMFGLGSKSALTYTSQFNLTCIKNGVRAHILVFMTDTGVPKVQVVHESTTNEHNGVEISIPIKNNDISRFNTKSRLFYSFWKPGTVLVNGQEPEYILNNATEVDKGIYLRRDLDIDYIVMGSVAYPVERKLYAQGWRQFGVVAYVPMGSVNLVPSREALHFTPLTEKTIADIKVKFSNGLVKSAQKDVDSAPTAAEGARRASGWRNTVYIREYRGEIIPAYIDTSDLMTYNSNAYRYTVDTRNSISLPINKGTLFVEGFTNKDITAVTKQKVKKYTKDNDMEKSYFVFVDKPIVSKWIDGVDRVKWEDVKAIKLAPRAPRNSVKKTEKYSVIDNGYLRDTNTIDTTKTIAYYSPAEYKGSLSSLTSALPNATLVELNRNRWAKFERDFPKAVHVIELFENNLNKAMKELTKVDKMVLSATYWDRNTAKYFSNEKIDDPELSKYIEDVSNSTKSDTYNRYVALTNILDEGVFKSFKVKAQLVGHYPRPFDKYPLSSTSHVKESVFYINAKYNNKEK